MYLILGFELTIEGGKLIFTKYYFFTSVAISVSMGKQCVQETTEVGVKKQN